VAAYACPWSEDETANENSDVDGLSNRSSTLVNDDAADASPTYAS